MKDVDSEQGGQVSCRAVDAHGDEARTLQERALWDLLSLFFLAAQQAQQSVSAHDLVYWLHGNIMALCGCTARAHPLPPSLVEELGEAALPEAHPSYWPSLQVSHHGCASIAGEIVYGAFSDGSLAFRSDM